MIIQQVNSMRALCYESYGNVDVLDLRDTNVPDIEDDEVLVQVHTASLNPFDWKLRSGMLRNVFDVEFPITPGRDGYGKIVALGKNAQELDLSEGQLVSFISSRLRQGSLAEYAAVSAKDNVVPAATNLTSQESAALPLVGLSAWNALVDTAKIQSGMRVLIHGGSGGVGAIAIQLAQHIGAETFATCSSANVAAVEALGAQAIPYDSVDFTAVISDCDAVFDTVGGQVHEDSYKVLKKGGRMVYLLAKPFGDRSAEYGVEDLQANVFGQTGNLRHVVEFAANGIIKPIIGQSMALAEFRNAFQLGESGKAGGKIVLSI